MIIEKQKDLSVLTSLKVGGKAQYFCIAKNIKDILSAHAFAKEKCIPLVCLGDGTNCFFDGKTIKKLILQAKIKGIKITKETSKNVFLQIGAGENWDKVVSYTVNKEFSGIEALSLIPGTCGAAPVQNIGAYGTDISQTIESVEVFDANKNELATLTKEMCQFSYRNSIFKKFPNFIRYLSFSTV